MVNLKFVCIILFEFITTILLKLRYIPILQNSLFIINLQNFIRLKRWCNQILVNKLNFELKEIYYVKRSRVVLITNARAHCYALWLLITINYYCLDLYFIFHVFTKLPSIFELMELQIDFNIFKNLNNFWKILYKMSKPSFHELK